MAEAVAIKVAAALAIQQGTTAFLAVQVATTLALTVATNAIVSALTPVPPSPKQSLLVNSRDATAPQEFVYGEVRKGGPITYLETTRGGSVLYQIIPLAAHEIESVEAIYINDEVATLSPDGYDNGNRTGAGWVTSPRKWSEDDDEGKHEIRVFYHLGDQTTITDTFANSSVESLSNNDFFGTSDEASKNFGGVGQPTKASFVGNGIAYLFVRFSYAADVFRNGIPVITARIKGKKVYNPDTGVTEYSNNATLCIRDFLTSAYGLNDPQVNDTVFINAANICDEDVLLADGITTEKRYTLNGVVRADQTYGDVLQQMITSCAGTLFWGGGKWKLTVGDYNAPTKTFTLDDLRSNISLQTRTNLRDQFNRVQGTFVNQDNRYITEDYPPYPPTADYPTSAFLAQDDGVEQALDLDLPFTTSSATAQRLAKMTLFRGREQMVFSADFGLNAFDVEVGEIVALTVDRYGWTEKEFEVVGWNFNSSSEGGDLRVSLTLRETSAAAFSWTAEESEIINNDSDLVTTLEPVGNLTATFDGTVSTDGTFLNGILVDWDSVVGSSGYEVEWTVNNSIDYAANGGIVEEADAVTTRELFIYKGYLELLYRQPDQDGFDFYNTGGGSGLDEAAFRAQIAASPERASLKFSGLVVQNPTTEYTIKPALDDTVYNIRVRAINNNGVKSLWRSVTFTTTLDSTTPNAPTSLSASGGFQSVTLSWSAPTSNTDSSDLDDLSGYNIYRAFVNNFASSVKVGSALGESYADTSLLDNTTYYYWVTAKDFTGNESSPSNVASATTTLVSGAQLVADIREEIGAARIDVVSSLPSGSGYNAGDFVFLTTDKKLYEWNGSSWVAAVGDVPSGSITSTQIADDAITTPKLATNSVTTDALAANSVTADQLTTNSVISGKIAAGAVSADKIAVTTLSAVTANMGTLTSGAIDTTNSLATPPITVGARLRPGIASASTTAETTDALELYRHAINYYCLDSINYNGPAIRAISNGLSPTSGGTGDAIVAINRGIGGSTCIDATSTRSNGATGPGLCQIALSGFDGGYGIYIPPSSEAGGLDGSGNGFSPFTGTHMGMLLKTSSCDPGDILVDGTMIVSTISDSFTEVVKSTVANQAGAIGVLQKRKGSWIVPPAFIDRPATKAAQAATPEGTKANNVLIVDPTQYYNDYDLVDINAVGEGAINVCGENGNISKGDLIVTSSMPGKGMKQADDIVRSYTVAKAREDVTFSDPTEVKMVACIYLCG